MQKADYRGNSLELSLPDIVILTGAGISFVQPEVGVPIALIGGAMAVFPPTSLSGISVAVEQDNYDRTYVGLGVSWGKAYPVTAFSVSGYEGTLLNDWDNSREAEKKEIADFIAGWGANVTLAGPAGGRGITWSPPAKFAVVDTRAFPWQTGGSFGYTWMLPP